MRYCLHKPASMKRSLPVFYASLMVFGLILAGCQKENPKPLHPPVAVAGDSKIIQLPADSVTLTGTGIPSDSKIVAYLWSEVSGPNVPVLTSAGAANTKVKGLVAGNYIFQLMVMDSLGLTGVDTLSVQVNAQTQYNLLLQPNANAFETVFGILGNADWTNAAGPELDAASWTVNSVPVILRSAFKFDLSSIPANAKILSAKLTLYSNPTPLNGDLINANSGSNNALYLQRAGTAWNSGTGWASQPVADTAGQVLIPHTNQHFLDITDLDVTRMLGNMYSQGNYGFTLRLQNESLYTIRNFCSSKYSDASKHPKLAVVYSIN